MLAHFNKLQTPLGSVHKYPTTVDQEARFSMAGWATVKAVNLWELWASSDLGFLTPSQRISLDHIEAFDEWEEFALFACHYFLLFAENGAPSSSSFLRPTENNYQSTSILPATPVKSNFAEYQQQRGCRRFAASLRLRSSNRQQDLVGDFGGMGLSSRLDSLDAYTPSDTPIQLFHQQAPSERPPSRMCHTITDMGDMGAILVGGRASPDKAMGDCWLYHKWTNVWERIDDLPVPRYRHATTFLGDGRVMIVGGKTTSARVVGDILTWDRRNGWMSIREEQIGQTLKSHLSLRFGAILCTALRNQLSSYGTIRGLLAGGMSPDGVILRDAWLWTLSKSKQEVQSLSYLIIFSL